MTITSETRPSSFAARACATEAQALDPASVDTFQVNIGLVCNLACHHCHVESSPKRREEMTWETMAQVLSAARVAGAHTLDVTGGAPEMNPHFRRLITEATAHGLHVIVRSNLTILLVEGYQDLPARFAELGIHVIASLPCYLQENVERQRGLHVYNESIEAIRLLNAEGYGNEDRLQLDLVYNPGGPSLPPDQAGLEQAYRKELDARFGIQFQRLITITNMPIGRFRSDLAKAGQADAYDTLLATSFNPATVDGLMCRHQVHVGYDGTLFDCDFNFALGMQAQGSIGHIRDFDAEAYLGRRIRTAPHCFGCTAGAGSSCTGALA